MLIDRTNAGIDHDITTRKARASLRSHYNITR